MMYPSSWLPHSYRWFALAVLFLTAAALAWKLSSQGKALTTPAAPNGILSFELSWSGSGGATIIQSWEKLKDIAREQLLWDYPFLVVYPLLLSLACAMLGESLGDAYGIVGAFVAWGVLLAGPLDALENYMLLKMLSSGASEGIAKLASWCAGIKFSLILSAFGYIVVAGVMRLFARS